MESPIRWQHTLGGLLLTVIAFVWIAPTTQNLGEYVDASYASGLRLRAFVGSIIDLFGLDAYGYVTLKCLALFAWHTLLVSVLASTPEQGLKRSFAEQAATIVPACLVFSFSTLTASALSLSDMVDGVAAFFILIAYLSLRSEEERKNPSLAIVAAACMVIAVLIHEKSLSELGILASWYFWKRGFVATFLRFVPVFILVVMFLFLAGQNTTDNGLTPAGYLQILRSLKDFLLYESFNVWAILAGGGALWLICIFCAWMFFFETHGTLERLRVFVMIASMAALVMAPLLVAHDTNRLVAIVWLPALILIVETRLLSRGAALVRSSALILCAIIQMLIPPGLVYEHGFIPYNCSGYHLAKKYLATRDEYARDDSVSPMLRPFGLFDHGRADIETILNQRCQ